MKAISEPRSSLRVHFDHDLKDITNPGAEWRAKMAARAGQAQLYAQLAVIRPESRDSPSATADESQFLFYRVRCAAEFFTREPVLHGLIVAGTD